MVNNKTGKRTDDPKVFQTRIRMSEEDLMYLEYCVERTGKSKADIIREGVKEIYWKLKEKE